MGASLTARTARPTPAAKCMKPCNRVSGSFWLICNRLQAWWSTQTWLATVLSSLIARRWFWLHLYDGAKLKTYLLMRWYGPDALAVVRPTCVYLLDFFCSCIQFYVLLSPCLCFISSLYLDLYVLGDNAWISEGYFMQTKPNIYMSWSTSLLRVRLARRETG